MGACACKEDVDERPQDTLGGESGGPTEPCNRSERRTSTAPDFPMWLLPMRHFLKMGGAPRGHQQLRDAGLLVQWQPGMFVIFVSHQWVAFAHPDPQGRQLQVLREALSAVMEGRRTVTCDVLTEFAGKSRGMGAGTLLKLKGAFIWYDYWSVAQPQLAPAGEEAETRRQMLRSVRTIPSYIGSADLFVALCPEVVHADTGRLCSYHSWSARGWCRLELASRGLSGTTADASSIVVVTSGTHVTFKTSFEWLTAPVGEGEFTVQADRELLHPIVARLVDTYISKLEGAGGVQCRAKRRFILALRGAFLHNLRALESPMSPASQERFDAGPADAVAGEMEVESFLQRFRFRSLLDRGEAGLSPLHCAAMEGKPGVLAAAVAIGADVNARTTQDFAEFTVCKGSTPLHFACLYAKIQNVAVVRCLLRLRGDPGCSNSLGGTPLATTAVMASKCGAGPKLEVMEALLDAQADLEQQSPIFGGSPLQSVAMGTHPEAAEVLLSRGAKVSNARGLFGTVLHLFAIVGGGSAELVSLLHRSNADVNERARPATLGGKAVLAGARLALSAGCQMEAVDVLGQLEGSTPLAMAARMGRGDLCEALLEAKADPSPPNARGCRALDLAVEQRHDRAAELLRAAPVTSTL